jgi:hypothetical protein
MDTRAAGLSLIGVVWVLAIIVPPTLYNVRSVFLPDDCQMCMKKGGIFRRKPPKIIFRIFKIVRFLGPIVR